MSPQLPEELISNTFQYGKGAEKALAVKSNFGLISKTKASRRFKQQHVSFFEAIQYDNAISKVAVVIFFLLRDIFQLFIHWC